MAIDFTLTTEQKRLQADVRSFAENVFYEVRNGKIAQVWSVIDKAAIEAQL